MGVLSKGTDFTNGDQVTDTSLDNLVDNATFTTSAVDLVSTDIGGSGSIIVRDGGITTAKLADSVSAATGVTAVKIASSAVTAAKIATDAVTTVKILDANVTTAKILDANVTTAKIADANVTFAKLTDIIDDDTMATATATNLATSESIKAYVDALSTRSKFITLTGGTNALEYEQTTSDGSKVWTIADFTSSDPDFDVTKITSLVVECEAYANSEATCKITATLPDAQVTTLISVAPNNNDGGSVARLQAINTVVLPINESQTTFTFAYDLTNSGDTARTFIRGANCEVTG